MLSFFKDSKLKAYRSNVVFLGTNIVLSAHYSSDTLVFKSQVNAFVSTHRFEERNGVKRKAYEDHVESGDHCRADICFLEVQKRKNKKKESVPKNWGKISCWGQENESTGDYWHWCVSRKKWNENWSTGVFTKPRRACCNKKEEKLYMFLLGMGKLSVRSWKDVTLWAGSSNARTGLQTAWDVDSKLTCEPVAQGLGVCAGQTASCDIFFENQRNSSSLATSWRISLGLGARSCRSDCHHDSHLFQF